MATKINERIWLSKLGLLVQIPATYKVMAMLNKPFGSSMFIL